MRGYVLTLTDDRGNTGKATCVDDIGERWETEYRRHDGTLYSVGACTTQPPHWPPARSLTVTLEELRAEDDYWAARRSEVAS